MTNGRTEGFTDRRTDSVTEVRPAGIGIDTERAQRIGAAVIVAVMVAIGIAVCVGGAMWQR